MTVHFLSKWQTQTPVSYPATDAERHEAFSKFAANMANASMPWLLPLLEQAGATLYVGPGQFAFHLPARPGHWFDVPEMARQITMLPWAEQEETPQ